MARYRRPGSSSGRGVLRTFFFTLLFLGLAALLAAAYFAFELERPGLTLATEVQKIGTAFELELSAHDRKSGLSLIAVSISQGGKSIPLYEKRFPRQGWLTQAGPRDFSAKIPIQARKAGLQEGPAELSITLRDQSLAGFLRGNKSVKVLPVSIDTTPPTLRIASPRRSLQPGGSAVISYSVSEVPARHGVQIGGRFFPGFPGAKEGSYVAYFALPWDAKGTGPAAVLALDTAGNEARVEFTATFKPIREKHDTLTISEGFLQRKIPEFEQYYPEMQGNLLQRYLYINGPIRQRNADKIIEVCANPVPEQLWSDRFLRMPGATRAGFADRRSYLYQGSSVDEQVHLGVDIASTAQAEIRAANRGKVVFAEYLGIYGNTVIIDHGQGLFTLYSHLSSIETSAGTMVDKNQPIGRSGTSGMAGGDHLHFSMLVHGIFVTPVQWWDQHWIDLHIKAAVNG